MECATNTRRVAGVTFVTCRMFSSSPREVRLRNELDGPVWPPRRRGVPAAGWDEDGVTIRVEGTVGVGYACPAPVAEPPVTVAETIPADETAAEPTPDAVVRALGDPIPPRDALSVDVAERQKTTRGPGGKSRDWTDDIGSRTVERSDAPGGGSLGGDSPGGDSPGVETVEAWLESVEDRVARVETLAEAETVPEATEALRSTGGLDGAATSVTQVERDREALAAFARRADRLRARAEANPNLGLLRRLA